MLSYDNIAARASVCDILELVHSEGNPEAAPKPNSTKNTGRYPGNHPCLRGCGGGYLNTKIRN